MKPMRFKELLEETQASTRTLSKHLRRLEENGTIKRVVFQSKPGVYYILISEQLFLEKAKVIERLEKWAEWAERQLEERHTRHDYDKQEERMIPIPKFFSYAPAITAGGGFWKSYEMPLFG